jgi:transcriptional regulator with XRE-family HTH domain
MRIGEFIAYKRKNMGYTQQQFAEILDISKQAVSKWENGTASPEFMLIPNLARYLDVTPELLANVMWLDLSGNPITHFVNVIVHEENGDSYEIKTFESQDYTIAQELYDRIQKGEHPDIAKLLSDYHNCNSDRTFSMEFVETTLAAIELDSCVFPIDTVLLDSCALNV